MQFLSFNFKVRVNELPLTLELESASTYCRHLTGKDKSLGNGSVSAFESRTKYMNVDSDGKFGNSQACVKNYV